MRKRSSKGVGSNQYVDRTQLNLVENEEQAKRDRQRTRRLASAPVSLGGGNPADTSQLVKGMDEALGSHVTMLSSGRPLTEEDFLSSAAAIGRFEDDILFRHQNMYGVALRDGLFFERDAQMNPELAQKVRSAGSPEHALHRAYRAILDDAKGDRTNELTLEELAVNLDTLNSATEARESGESEWHGGLVGEPSLSSRYAAASVISSRNPEDSSLREQVSALRNRLHEEGVLKINF